MIYRFLILFFFTSLFGLLSLLIPIGNEYDNSLFGLMFTCFLVGLAAIAYTIVNYKKIELTENALSVDYLLRATKKFSFDKLTEWQESRYYLRGKLQRSLVLFFSNEDRLIVSNQDFRKEFERLASFLKEKFDLLDTSPDRRVIISFLINHSTEEIFKAWREPKILASWWTPNESVATFDLFEFRDNGRWRFVLHAKGGKTSFSYNFIKIKQNQLVSWRDDSLHGINHHFKMEKIGFEKTKINYEIVFSSIEECQKSMSVSTKNGTEAIIRLEEELQRL
jgi:uncharacterized protein YndB with AHSA1/START domain